MKYCKTIQLRDGRECVLRNGTKEDGAAAWANFNLTHEQTDFMLSLPGENSLDPEQSAQFLQAKTDSEDEIEILAEVDGQVAGTAGIEHVGRKEKVKHRAVFGISIDKKYWGQGIGKALMEACLQCAREAGYAQVELEVVADNKRAMALYQKYGFVEYGRNPRGFHSRLTGWQEVVLMRLEMNE